MAFTTRLSRTVGCRFYSTSRRDVVIVSATRTPIGSFQSSLSALSASQLGGIAVESAVQQAGIAKEDVDEVILGNVVSAGLGNSSLSIHSFIISRSSIIRQKFTFSKLQVKLQQGRQRFLQASRPTSVAQPSTKSAVQA